jgi:endonuclease YncB( thermonuclease family)
MCKTNTKDRYNRFIAECYKDKTNINRWMVSNGYAVAYKKYSKKFVSEENLAKKDKLGLWAGTFEMPWNWRKNN